MGGSRGLLLPQSKGLWQKPGGYSWDGPSASAQQRGHLPSAMRKGEHQTTGPAAIGSVLTKSWDVRWSPERALTANTQATFKSSLPAQPPAQAPQPCCRVSWLPQPCWHPQPPHSRPRAFSSL